MKNLTVTKVDSTGLTFSNGSHLGSDHQQDCCENHYLSFDDLKIEDFKGLKFDLSNETFFRGIEDYGIELIPIYGWPVKIPGYGQNNGYYSSQLDLVISTPNQKDIVFDITECQEQTEY